MEINYIEADSNSIFKRRTPLVILSFYICGIFVSRFLEIYYQVSMSILTVSLIAVLVSYFKENKKALAVSSIILLISMAWFRTDMFTGQLAPNHIGRISEHQGRAIVIGRIVEEPDVRDDRFYLLVESDSVFIGNFKIPAFGKIRIKVKSGNNNFNHSDVIKASGFLYNPDGKSNPGGFDYKSYLNAKNIFGAMTISNVRDIEIVKRNKSFLSSIVTPLREFLISTTDMYLSPEASAILSGFILGERRNLPEKYKSLFRDTGTLHLMVVSGSNVALIIAIFLYPMLWLGIGRKLRMLILLIVISFFAILTKLEPSVLRASIMAFIGLMAFGWFRKPDLINVISFTALIMLIWNPMQLFDIGLQLSFAAAFGIIYALPISGKIAKRLKLNRYRIVSFVYNLSLVTVAAQLAVMPLMANYFNKFPIIGLIANIPIGFFAGFVTIAGVVFYIGSIFGGFFSGIFAIPLQLAINIIIRLLELFSKVPDGTVWMPSFSWPIIFLYWTILYMIMEFFYRKRFSKNGLITALVMFNVVLFQGLMAANPEWKIRFLDLGSNHGWIYSDKDGKTYGCFDFYQDGVFSEGVIIPHIIDYFDDKLDYLITSTPESNEIMELIKEYSPVLAMLPGPETGDFYKIETNDKSHNLGDNVKIVWGGSDNIEMRGEAFPILEINTGNGFLIMAGWADAVVDSNYFSNRNVRLIELPWSSYSRGKTMRQINLSEARLIAFSPDSYSRSLPRDRNSLSHGQDRVISTSLNGGFEISSKRHDLRLRTMKLLKTTEQ